jgi:hypothetical protein
MPNKSCCDDNGHDCLQSDACPIYQQRRRVRAGQPPKVELWINDEDYTEPELSEGQAIAIVAAIVVVVGLFAFGMVAVL